MRIDEQLYIKSRAMIPNRTEDYEDYLRRRLGANNRLEMLEKERTETINHLNHIEKEIHEEREFVQNIEKTEMEYEQMMEKAVDTLTNIYENHGFIGSDNLESIATFNEISLGELKNRLPEEMRSKIIPTLFNEKKGRSV